MNRTANPPVTGPSCPTDQELLAYYFASASVTDRLAVESHLETCERCLLRLDAQDETSDTIVRALSTMPVVGDDEPQFRNLRTHLLSSTGSRSQTCGPGTGDWETSDALELPSRVGAYELIELIGSGATGRVYKARHHKLDRIVAVKVIDSGHVRDPRSMLRFFHEMRAIGRLDHPHVIRATDAGQDGGLHFLVMEYAPGLDLSTLLQQNGPLEIADACEIVRQASLGLDFAHGQGLIHRDVKPSNLLLCFTGQIKLLDLGLVVIQDDRNATTACDGTALGTADYMSPEQWQDASQVDASTDLYGLGCTLFKLLTGHAPFGRSAWTVVAKREAHLQQPIPSLRSERPDAPPSLERLLQRLLAKEPSGRYASAHELADALGPFVSGSNLYELASRYNPGDAAVPYLSPHVSSDSGPADRSPGRVRRRALLAGLAGSAVLLLLSRWSVLRAVPRPLDKRWRTLSPSPRKTFLPLDPQAVIHHDERNNAIAVSATEEILVELGSPIKACFDFRTALCQEEWAHPSGLFFKCHTHASLEGVTHLFESILLVPDAESSSYNLVWKSCRYDLDDGHIDHEDRVLGQATVPVRTGATRNELQVSVGRTRYPEVTWNGVTLPESRWQLSWEARQTREAIRPRQQLEYLGSVGLVVQKGKTTFEETALRYFDS